MSITIAALVAMAASAAAEAAPVIQEAVADFLREVATPENLKTLVKCNDWRKIKKDVVDEVKDISVEVSDYVNYKDDNGGWTKK